MTDRWTHSDVIEEIISEEIVDETDQYEDNQSKRRARRITTADVMRGCAFLTFSRAVDDDGDRGIGSLRENVELTRVIRMLLSAHH